MKKINQKKLKELEKFYSANGRNGFTVKYTKGREGKGYYGFDNNGHIHQWLGCNLDYAINVQKQINSYQEKITCSWCCEEIQEEKPRKKKGKHICQCCYETYTVHKKYLKNKNINNKLKEG